MSDKKYFLGEGRPRCDVVDDKSHTAVECLACNEQGKDTQRHKVWFSDTEFSVLLCCALFFTRLVYGAGGVSAVVIVLNRAGQASLEIWLRYSSVTCFLPDAEAILPYLE